jgi:hypothetical protein
MLRHIGFYKKRKQTRMTLFLPLQYLPGEIDRKIGQLYMKNHQSKLPAALSKHLEKTSKQQALTDSSLKKPLEIGGPKGPEPTRYGDWEKAGRCSDF